MQNSTLDKAPIKSADTGISFEKPVGIGVDDTKLTIGAGVSGSLKILTSQDKQLFDPEIFGDSIDIAGNQAYMLEQGNSPPASNTTRIPKSDSRQKL